MRLQGELVKLQDWVQTEKLKVVVLFEGRDSAGKGGVIKRITQRLNPARLPRRGAARAERARAHAMVFPALRRALPAGGEIVLFDRSWYNRAGVERVMGFCTDEQYEEFFRSVPEFERMLVRSGIILVKYWFSITDDEQQFRFMHAHPRSAEAVEAEPDGPRVARSRWEEYTKAKEMMLERTHIAGVAVVDRRGGRQEARPAQLHRASADPDPVPGGRATARGAAAARPQSRLSPRPDSAGDVRAFEILTAPAALTVGRACR